MSKASISGFIYIWMDMKKNRFYIGSHWGEPNDGYVCSSSWMKQAYKNRPRDFKRRILKTLYSRAEILAEEHRYLSMINDKELGKRYYNLIKKSDHHWHQDPKIRLTVAKKIAKSRKGSYHGLKGAGTRPNTSKTLKEAYASGIRLPAKGMLGKKHSKYSKKKSSESNRIAHLGKPVPNNQRLYEITHPDGSIKIIKGLVQFCKNNNFHPSIFSRLSNGKYPTDNWNGYRVNKINA